MLTRRELLWSGAGLCSLGYAPIASPSGTLPGGKKLLYVYVSGAWDLTYTFDPKLGVDAVDGPEVFPPNGHPLDVEDEDTVGGHRIAINPIQRPNVLEYFERWGAQTLSVAGVTIGGIAHYPNRLRVLTGGTDRRRPDLCAILGGLSDVTEPLGAMDLSGWSFHGPHGAVTSRAGYRWQLQGLLDPSTGGLGNPLTGPQAEDDLVEAYLKQRAQTLAEPGPHGTWAADFHRSLDRLGLLRERREALAALFDRSSSSADDNLDLAIDLLAGSWARSVLVDTRYYFDTHDNNQDQSGLNDRLFRSLSRMMQRLEDQGILDDTLVVVTSEMTRSLKLNRYSGKDHWPLVGYLLMGGGVRGGRRIGQTDDVVNPLPIDLVTGAVDPNGSVPGYDQIFAGILELLDVDPEAYMPGVQPLSGLSA